MLRHLSIAFLAILVVSMSVSALPASRLKAVKAHGAFCHLCEDLIKDGKLASDVVLDEWIDKEIGTRCTVFGALESECLKELKQVEHDIWEAIDQEIPEDKMCTEVELC